MKVGAEFQYLGLLQKKETFFLMKDACQLCPIPIIFPPPPQKEKEKRKNHQENKN
jgi:hypothetical protein